MDDSQFISNSTERTLIFADMLENGEYLFKTEYGSLINEQMARDQVLALFERARRKMKRVGKEHMRLVIEISSPKEQEQDG